MTINLDKSAVSLLLSLHTACYSPFCTYFFGHINNGVSGDGNLGSNLGGKLGGGLGGGIGGVLCVNRNPALGPYMSQNFIVN